MKFLVIRLSSIGDIILTSPVVRCLAKQMGSEVHVLTRTAYTSLYTSNPYVAKVHAYANEQLRPLIEGLKAEKFDHVIDLQKSRRSISLRSRIGVSATSFPKVNLQKWLKVNLKWDLLPDAHIVQRYLKAVDTFGVRYDGDGLDLFIDRAIEPPAAVSQTSQPYIAFAIGAAHGTKRLPPESLADLCSRIKHPIILLGGSTEKEIGEDLAKTSPLVTSLCGTCSLQESAAVLRKAALVISHDTGMMHMAAALQKPIFSIWGNTIPGFGMTPFYRRENPPIQRIFEVSGLSCRPCSKIGYETCPKGHFSCMLDQDMEKIGREVEIFMSKPDLT